MGVFFYTHSVALAEDLSIDTGNSTNLEDFYLAVDASYTQVGYQSLFFLRNIIKMFLHPNTECLQLLDCGPNLSGNSLHFGSPVLAEQSCFLPSLMREFKPGLQFQITFVLLPPFIHSSVFIYYVVD